MIHLPIDDHLKKITDSLKLHSNLVISAAPGAGKTTRVPPALLQLTDKKVLVLEPRRIAASAAAGRIAEEQGWNLGQEVGYQVRFENKTSSNTRLIFLTEALLSRHLLEDPDLANVGLIVLDEFHERSQHVDLAIGFLKELQELSRPDLKIVVMSATLDAKNLSSYLADCPVIEVPGKLFPMEIFYQKSAQLLKTTSDFIDRVVSQIKGLLPSQPTGEHVLVFLPGVGEIERVSDALENTGLNVGSKNYETLKLHGSLTLEEQRRVLSASPSTKIILSTNVAESSLTIDGVSAVIDSGLARVQRLNPRTGYPRLDLVRISKASATQRAGRSARQGAGRVFRLWTPQDELSMSAFETAEIFRVSLTETLLMLAHWGVQDFMSFSWYEKPSKDSIAAAQKELEILGCLTKTSSLTDLGRRALKWPLPARLAVLMEAAVSQKQEPLAARIAALLLDKDFLRQSPSSGLECDLLVRLELLEARRAPGSAVRAYEKTVQQLLRVSGSRDSYVFKATEKTHLDILDLLFSAFPDRLSRRRKKGDKSAVLITGRGVTLDDNSCVQNSEFFFAMELMDGVSQSETKCRKATGLTRAWLEKKCGSQIEVQNQVEYSEENEKVQKIVQKALVLPGLGSLPIEEGQVRPASQEEAAAFFPQIVIKNQAQLFEKNESLSRWWKRYQMFCHLQSVPPFTVDEMNQILEEAAYGESLWNQMLEKDLIYFFEKALDKSLLDQMKRSLPAEMIIPTGRAVPLNYTPEGVQIEVRIQEIFGLKNAPIIAEGKVPVTFVLLGPNYRPVQVTSDLPSFWKNGYPEIKKELKARYPKHSWPEDPLTAPPQAKPSRRK